MQRITASLYFLCAWICGTAYAQPATQTGYSFCQVDDVIGSRTFWVSPVFEFSYLTDSPAGFLQRTQELATEFHTAVSSQGGAGDKNCYAPAPTRAEAEANLAQTRSIITKKFMGVFGTNWKEVTWTPKAWNPATASNLQPTVQYFYCYASDMHPTVRKTVASYVFEKNIPGSDLSARYNQANAYQDEFQRTVALPQGVDASSLCEVKDSRAEAEKSRKDIRGLFSGFNLHFVDVAWTPTATVPAAVAVTTAASTPSRLGVKLDAVTPTLALGLGLAQPEGALVIAIKTGSAAEKAGLKPLDVITEIAGQGIQNPADVQAIVSRMRSGYRAPLRIWRERATLDIAADL